MVAEYTADELNQNSDGEKMLEKAKRAAEQKVAKKKKLQDQRVRPYNKRQPHSQAPLSTSGNAMTSTMFQPKWPADQ